MTTKPKKVVRAEFFSTGFWFAPVCVPFLLFSAIDVHLLHLMSVNPGTKSVGAHRVKKNKIKLTEPALLSRCKVLVLVMIVLNHGLALLLQPCPRS